MFFYLSNLCNLCFFFDYNIKKVYRRKVFFKFIINFTSGSSGKPNRSLRLAAFSSKSPVVGVPLADEGNEKRSARFLRRSGSATGEDGLFGLFPFSNESPNLSARFFNLSLSLPFALGDPSPNLENFF